MSQQEVIPNGHAKNTPLDAATEKDIKFWLGRKEQDLQAEPTGRFAPSNRRWVEAAKAELARRAAGGKVAAAPAGSPTASKGNTAIQLQQAAPIEVLGRATHDAAAVTASLHKLAASYHLVSPATSVDVLPPGCGVAISAVLVDLNPANGDIYKVGDKFGLSGVVLSKIWAAAGGSWVPKMSGRVDDGSDPNYCHYRAVGCVLKFDGSTRVCTGEVEIDAREGSPQIDEIRAKAREREKKPDYRGKKDGGDSQILELRKFLLRHAERKAKNRAVADLGLARAYTEEQLKKPFAVTQLMFTGESDDPALRLMFASKTADAMLRSRSLLFDEPQAQLQPPAPHALPAPSFRQPPPALPVRQTYEAPADAPAAAAAAPAPAPTPAPAPAPTGSGAPTAEELAAEREHEDAQSSDFGGGDDDIPF